MFLEASIRIQTRPMRENFDRLLCTPLEYCVPPAKQDRHEQGSITRDDFCFLPSRYGALVYLLYGFNSGPVSAKTGSILWGSSWENG